jgi:hypothetical protein
MKKICAIVALAISCALTPFSASAQTVTPNAGLQVPTYSQLNWQVPVIYDLTRLDNIFGGSVPVPSITLSGAIVNANQAATKAYVDATASGFLSASGATMIGPLVLAADPTAALQAATKQYVDNAVAAGGGSGTLTSTAIDDALGFAPQSAANVSAAIAASQSLTPSFTSVTLSGSITASTQATTKAYVDAAIAGVSASTFTGGTLTQPLILSGSPTTALGAATKGYVDNATVGFLSTSGGSLSGVLNLSDGTPAASEAYVASAVSGLSTTTTNQLLATKITSASAPGKICAAVAGINGSVECSGVVGTPLSITVQTGLNTPILNTVGATNSVAQYGLNVNSSTNTQILLPTTIGSFDQASVFKREMWFTGGSNLNGVDNWEVDTYNFDKTDQWEYMFGWQCNRHNTGFWQYDNFKHGWANTSVPCSIVSGHTYHFILWMHRDAVTSTACSGTGADASVTAGPCEYWDTFQLDDVTAATSNTYNLNAKLVAEPASLGGWQTWDGVGAQVQLDVVDSSTGGSSTLVSMFTDNDTVTAYIPVTSTGGGSQTVTETTGNLGEFDFDTGTGTAGLTATGTPTLDSNNSYTSPNAALFNGATEYYSAPITSSTHVWARAMVNVTTAPTSSSTQFLGLYNGSAQLINLFFNSVDGLIKVNNTAGTDTITICSAAALTPGTWHRVELAWVQSTTAGSFQVLIDGVSGCNVTGVTTGASPATSVRFGEMSAPSPVWVFDMDNVGVSSTGLLGPVTINTNPVSPLYDLFGSAAAVKASSLQIANNLSDLTSPQAALSNLLGNPPAGSYVVSCASTSSCSAIGASETVAFSATPTFSNTTRSSYLVLTGNVTSFTLPAGVDGQGKTFLFCQDATGSRTISGVPANVRGFTTIGATASKCSSQHFRYSVALNAWLADGAAVTNE